MSEQTVIPPSPDTLALAFATALMQSGQYETPGAAITAAWSVVPEFYLAREWYAKDIAPMFFSPTSDFAGASEELGKRYQQARREGSILNSPSF